MKITLNNPMQSRSFSGNWTCCSLSRSGKVEGFDNSPSFALPRTSLVRALTASNPPNSLRSTYTSSALYYRGFRVVEVNGNPEVMSEVAAYLADLDFDRMYAKQNNKHTPKAESLTLSVASEQP